MMSILRMILALFILQIMASCQVKEGSSSGGGLISDHVPATNKFTVQVPASKTFVEGEVIIINVTYPFDILSDFTGGNPRLRVTVGSANRLADFDSQPEPRKLVFHYTVQAGDLDANGIDVNALELNGSVLQFDNKGVITNCDVTTVKPKNFSGAKVDTVGPTITDFKLTNLPGLYNAGEKINFSMSFSEPVYVTGSPLFTITLTTGGTVNVNYVTGSGTNLLSFSYTVTSSDADSDTFGINSPIDVGTGAIKDVVGNDANLDFTSFISSAVAYSANVIINGQYPYVTNVILPMDGTYIANDDLDFILEFDRPVNLTGQPYLEVVIGSNTREAHYVSGSGTEQITFRYTAVPGDVDPDGISVTGSIVRDGGNIVDAVTSVSYFASAFNNAFTVPSTSGIILNAIQPQAISANRNADVTTAVWGTAVDNVWIIGQELNITIGFNTGMFVNQSNGTPGISLIIGSTTREALYVSGGNGQTSLLFRYTVQEGDLDTDNTITLGQINLNGGVITDSENTNTLLTLPALANTKIDGVRPTITGLTSPTSGTYSEIDPLNEDDMDLRVNWSEPVNYSSTSATATFIAVDIGGTSMNFRYVAGNNSNTITYNPPDLDGRNDSNGITVSSPLSGTAVIKDQAGNTASVKTFTPPNTSGVLVDTTAPTVTSMIPITSDGTHKAGDDIRFQVTFSEPVTTTVSGGYPRIPLVIGSTTRYLLPTANKTDTIHIFSYMIQAGEEDTDGVSVLGNFQNGTSGHALDAGRNQVATNFTAPATPEIKVDAVVPTIDSRSFSTARAYVSGETLQISITYSENINVDTSGGTPYIAVDFDQGTDNYQYSAGSGSKTLVFSRPLDGSHFDMTGLPSSVTTITLNGGTLQDVGRNNAPLTFSAINLSTTFVTYEGVKLWVKKEFENLAPPGRASITPSGTLTTESCGTGTCRTFDGDDRLYLNSSMNAKSVFMAFKTPPNFATVDIFGPDIELRDQAYYFNIRTASATINLNGTTYNTNDTTHNVYIGRSTSHVLQVVFQYTRNLNAEYLINSDFQGAIGEVIAADGSLNSTQIDNIRNYLNSLY